ncbi:hypothetical protein Bhyg_12197 [Pseudolycoriella hygida]|uniref:DUF7869 domain-containing protein n=1 Tax=Pseudolycoriella hygida TaxID=35572 RepID=A0A9Q0S078_9DIPT|nr:hypothetical protein Bhyg_12197 [Pseudolycoriella hygida]
MANFRLRNYYLMESKTAEIKLDEKTTEKCEYDLPMRQPESTPEKKPPSRWRQRNPDNHKKAKNMRRRNAGRPYETAEGNFIPPRTIGNECKCRKKCRSRLFGKELQLFHAFWDLESHDKEKEQAKRHYKSRTKDPAMPPKRNVSYKYYVNLLGQQIPICKVEFLAVHGLQFSAKRVDLLSRKLKTDVLIPPSDGRGKHKHHRRIEAETLNLVRQHINVIPKYVSHYSRLVNPNKVYLDCDMTISALYRKYVEWIDEKNKNIEVTNIKPIDVSAEKDAAVIDRLNVELETHQIDAKKMEDDLKKSIEQAKNSGDYDVFIFDLQQALLTPTLTVSEAFYSRKALAYNFGIHDGITGKVYMFLWTDNVPGRGSDEIGSCIWKYIKIRKPTSKHLVIYSDNCGGQNKNWNLMAIWRQLVLDGVYESIEHRFLIPGHTHRDFALIEKQKNRIAQVYSPEHWYEREYEGVLYVRQNSDGPYESVKIEKSFVTDSSIENMAAKKYKGDISLTRSKIDDLKKLIPLTH